MNARTMFAASVASHASKPSDRRTVQNVCCLKGWKVLDGVVLISEIIAWHESEMEKDGMSRNEA